LQWVQTTVVRTDLQGSECEKARKQHGAAKASSKCWLAFYRYPLWFNFAWCCIGCVHFLLLLSTCLLLCMLLSGVQAQEDP
jgi:hypothetical protein